MGSGVKLDTALLHRPDGSFQESGGALVTDAVYQNRKENDETLHDRLSI
jgi:hypothetical protein